MCFGAATTFRRTSTTSSPSGRSRSGCSSAFATTTRRSGSRARASTSCRIAVCWSSCGDAVATDSHGTRSLDRAHRLDDQRAAFGVERPPLSRSSRAIGGSRNRHPTARLKQYASPTACSSVDEARSPGARLIERADTRSVIRWPHRIERRSEPRRARRDRSSRRADHDRRDGDRHVRDGQPAEADRVGGGGETSRARRRLQRRSDVHLSPRPPTCRRR